MHTFLQGVLTYNGFVTTHADGLVPTRSCPCTDTGGPAKTTDTGDPAKTAAISVPVRTTQTCRPAKTTDEGVRAKTTHVMTLQGSRDCPERTN